MRQLDRAFADASLRIAVRIVLAGALLAVYLAAASPASAWSNGYSYRRTVTVHHGEVSNTDQSNFPVVMSGTYSDLATTSHGGYVTNSSGYDIIFTSDSAGTTTLAYERESYDASTGGVVFWVKIPTLSHTTDTVIYLFYGNSSITTDQSNGSGTWSSSYKGVWHLPNGSTLSTNDSTSNANNASVSGSVSATTGEIGGGASFSGSSNYASAADSSSLEISSNLTISAWVKYTMSSGSDSPGIITKDDAGIGEGYGLYLTYESNAYIDFDLRVGGSWINVTSPSTYNDGSWHHVVGTYNGSTVALYVDGSQVANTSASGSIATSSDPLEIGTFASGGSATYFVGTLDELRVSNTSSSADWIATEYNNQSNPSAFASVGCADNGGGCSSYVYSRAISIDHTKVSSSDQSNFPVLIDGTYSYLATTGNGGAVTSSNGYDIIFTSDSAGTSPLAFERESYNASTGAVVFWVKVPTLSHTADTTIYMFYNNSSIITDQSDPTGVWGSSYKGVWHLPNGTTLTTNDSTSAANNASVSGSVSATTGQIGGGASFSGSPNYINVPDVSNLEITGDLTVSAWVNYTMSGGSNSPGIIAKDDASVGEGYGLYLTYLNNAYIDFDLRIGTTWVTLVSPSTYNDGNWHYVVGTYNGSTAALYVDGTQIASTSATGSIQTSTNPLKIGTFSSGGSGTYFTGKLDELRVSNAADSAGSIATEYNNQSSPSTFYSIGSTSGGGPAPTILSLSPEEGPTGTIVIIAGLNFGSSGTVKFNGTIATSATWNSSTSLTATVPTGAATGDVEVTVGGQTNDDGHTFTVTSSLSGPVISNLSPSQGDVGTTVTITGTNFGSSGSVTFDGTIASATWNSTTSITATVPTGANSGDVVVTVSSVASDGTDFIVTGASGSGSSDVYYYFTDALGSSRVIAADDGTVCYDADLYPFGGERAYQDDCEPTQKFTGYERDAETGLDNAQARSYASIYGRFMMPDPANFGADPANPQSWNMYSYVLNNPLNMTDPTGLCGSDAGDQEQCGNSGTPNSEFVLPPLGPPSFQGSFFGDALSGIGYTGSLGANLRGSCRLDGAQIGCGIASEAVANDSATECPGSCMGIMYNGNGVYGWLPAGTYVSAQGQEGNTVWDWVGLLQSGRYVLIGPPIGSYSCFGGDAICSPGGPPRAQGNIQSDDVANLAMAGVANSAVDAGAEALDAFKGINNNPLLRMGSGYDETGNRMPFRIASGGRWGKGGPKLPWHWHIWPR